MQVFLSDLMRSGMLKWGRNFVIGMLMCLGAAAASAETVTPEEAAAIKAVVQSQIKALEEENAVTAFALTTPAVRQELGSPENLLYMIKQDYDPLCRHLRAIYLTAEDNDGNVTQTVRITDPDNRVWLVVYEMERQGDGTWRIDGWELLETDTLSI